MRSCEFVLCLILNVVIVKALQSEVVLNESKGINGIEENGILIESQREVDFEVKNDVLTETDGTDEGIDASNKGLGSIFKPRPQVFISGGIRGIRSSSNVLESINIFKLFVVVVLIKNLLSF